VILQPLDLDAVLGVEPPPPADYVIDGYLERGTHLLLCGRGGTGKTMVVNQLVARDAALGLGVDASRIVWIDAEMGVLGTQRRYWRTGLRGRISPGSITYYEGGGMDITNQAHWDELRRAADGVDLVVIDSLRRVSRYTAENSSDEMSAAVTDLTHLAHESGAGIVTIHHQGGDPHKWFRGSTAILDACDALIGWLPHHFDGDDDKLRRLAARGTWAKTRHEKEPDDLWFQQRDNGLFVPVDEAPEQDSVGKYDEAILALLPFDGTKQELAEAVTGKPSSGAFRRAYERVAQLDGGNKRRHITTDRPEI
jgi:RecA/RadA recombinase